MSFKRKPKNEEEFIQGADDQGQGLIDQYPWDEYRNGPKSFNIRLSEEDYAMLRYVFEHSTSKSLQKFIRAAIRKEVVEKINELRDKE